MTKARVYADFQNADAQGRVRMNCIGTMEDLARQQVELQPGLSLTLYSDDLDAQGRLDELVAEGVVSFSEEEHCWVATIDWSAIRHASEVGPASQVPAGPAAAPDRGIKSSPRLRPAR
jgi:hypothetical protein